MSDFLPADLFTRILIRLPVAGLLRCRSVSKGWRALIDSPRFTKLQIAYSAATAKNAILFINELHGDYVVADYVDGLRRGIQSTPRAQKSGTDPREVYALLGSCNGLICFACDWEKVLISNPATRMGWFMPFTLSGNSPGLGVYDYTDGRGKLIYSAAYGFGHDPVSDDYKVVQITQLFKTRENSLQSGLCSYGVRSDSAVEVGFPYVLPGSRKIGVLLSGAIHWTVARHDPEDSLVDDVLDSEPVIVGFDLGRNELREVPQPDYTHGESFCMEIGELGKCLCIFANYKKKFVDVWMMKKYGVKESWSILFSVRHPGLCYINDGIRPLGFSVTGKEALLQLDGKRLVWYDLKDPKKVAAAEKLNVRGLKGKDVDAVLCLGSLVSPYGKLSPPIEEVKVVEQKQKPGQQRKKRDEFLAAGFNLKL